jgi:TetR/AcrR family transcriptional regulator, transcriptional repressor for nem operon
VRVSKEQAAQNRQDILTAAARLFREQSIHATGVDAITKEAGLTHGGLYSQFGSKEAIAAEAIRFAAMRSKHLWQRAVERRPGPKAFRSIMEGYCHGSTAINPARAVSSPLLAPTSPANPTACAQRLPKS